MKLNYVKLSPSQNMTILITDPVQPEDYSAIANAVMDYASLYAEQVGFMLPPSQPGASLHLHMAGGEFCGNALLSAAAYGTFKGLCPEGTFLVETSGSKKLLRCETVSLSEHRFQVRGEMPAFQSVEPLPQTVKGRTVSGSLVRLDGISHFVTPLWLTEEQEFEDILSVLQQAAPAPALGIVPYREQAIGRYEIKPMVYVSATGSRVYERACGSGSYSVGLHLAQSHDTTEIAVQQPGGVLQVGIGPTNWIATEVSVASEGEVYIVGPAKRPQPA